MAYTRARVVEQISASADRVFGEIGAFNNLTVIMAGTITRSTLDKKGVVRTLKVKGVKGALDETLLKYDVATRVPLIVYDPRAGEDERGAEIDELVLSIDVPATIVSFGGAEVAASMQGRDLRPLMENPRLEWRDEIFLESLFLLRTGPFMEAVRTKEWKYVRFFPSSQSQYVEADTDFEGKEPAFEQLFDLVNDPTELHNMIADESQAGRIEAFRERCKRHSAALFLARSDTETYPR